MLGIRNRKRSTGTLTKCPETEFSDLTGSKGGGGGGGLGTTFRTRDHMLSSFVVSVMRILVYEVLSWISRLHWKEFALLVVRMKTQ